MKIFALLNSDTLALPTLAKLNELGLLAGLALVKKSEKALTPALDELELGLKPLILDRKTWVTALETTISKLKIDSVWVLTFPWIIPPELLTKPPLGFINFHFGLLPKYKGADPIFWQFKNRESHGGLTVHLMNEEVDEGPVLFQDKIPYMPGETHGFHCMNLGKTATGWVEQILEAVEKEPREYLELEQPDEVFDKKPGEEELTIDWKTQSAEEIEWLVNGANPTHGGVKTVIADVPMYILEVTPVDMQGEVKAEPGQIVHADATYGIVVYCADGMSIRITIVRTREGYLSGVKLFNLGFNVGHKFD